MLASYEARPDICARKDPNDIDRQEDPYNANSETKVGYRGHVFRSDGVEDESEGTGNSYGGSYRLYISYISNKLTLGIRAAFVGARFRWQRSISVIKSTAKPRPQPQYLESGHPILSTHQ